MVEIDTIFQTKTAKKPYLLRRTYLCSLYKEVATPPPPHPPVAKNAVQITSRAPYASETNEVNLTLTFIQRLGY